MKTHDARAATDAQRQPAGADARRTHAAQGPLSQAIDDSPAMVAQRQRLQVFADAPARRQPGVVQRHVFLDIPEQLHDVDDFGNWYTIAAEYKQQEKIASLQQLKSSPADNSNNAPTGETQEQQEQQEPPLPALIDPATFVTSLRSKASPVTISLEGGVKLQVHGIPDISAQNIPGLAQRFDLSKAEQEKDQSIKAGKNIAIGQAIVSAQAIADHITSTYGVPWSKFYPMYCFAAEPGGQWARTGLGGLGAGPLLNTPGQIATFDGNASMAGWASFENKPKKYISNDGAWNGIAVTPLAGLSAYIQEAKAGKLPKQELTALLRKALDEVYSEVAPEYDAFRRYLHTQKAITGETPNPWGL